MAQALHQILEVAGGCPAPAEITRGAATIRATRRAEIQNDSASNPERHGGAVGQRQQQIGERRAGQARAHTGSSRSALPASSDDGSTIDGRNAERAGSKKTPTVA